MSHEDDSFFERERDRLSREITSGFEELLSSTNVLNRKLEEVLGMSKEYTTIASLWHTFYRLMQNSGQDSQALKNDIQDFLVLEVILSQEIDSEWKIESAIYVTSKLINHTPRRNHLACLIYMR